MSEIVNFRRECKRLCTFNLPKHDNRNSERVSCMPIWTKKPARPEPTKNKTYKSIYWRDS